jgi:hypothetical protein
MIHVFLRAKHARHNLAGIKMLHSGSALFQAGFLGNVSLARHARPYAGHPRLCSS